MAALKVKIEDKAKAKSSSNGLLFLDQKPESGNRDNPTMDKRDVFPVNAGKAAHFMVIKRGHLTQSFRRNLNSKASNHC